MPESHDTNDREPTPRRGKGYNQAATIAGLETTLTTNEYEDGRLAGFEFRIDNKSGAGFQAIVNLFSRSVSLGLEHGVPLGLFVDEFTFTRFDPAGMVSGNETIKNATSIIDYLFRELGVSYLDRQDLVHVKVDRPNRKKARAHLITYPITKSLSK